MLSKNRYDITIKETGGRFAACCHNMAVAMLVLHDDRFLHHDLLLALMENGEKSDIEEENSICRDDEIG